MGAVGGGDKNNGKADRDESVCCWIRSICCWIRGRSFRSCLSLRSKVHHGISTTTHHESELTGLLTMETREAEQIDKSGKDYANKSLKPIHVTLKRMQDLMDQQIIQMNELKSQQLDWNAVGRKFTNADIESNSWMPSSMTSLEEDTEHASCLCKFTLKDLKLATRNLGSENLLGKGRYGCSFKGWIEKNETVPVTGPTVVVVKTLFHDRPQDIEGPQAYKKEWLIDHNEWLANLNFLGNLAHPNLVKLVGYCIEDDQRLLVSEYMPQGSLDNHLFNGCPPLSWSVRMKIALGCPPLSWSVRMKIALGVARGLAFLHDNAEGTVIYGDFKTSKILLDADYNAKLSDYGLFKDSVELNDVKITEWNCGAFGYNAPECVMTGQHTRKSDVFSFGVVFLEMLTGRRSRDYSLPRDKVFLLGWALPLLVDPRRFYRLIDPRLEGQFSIKGAHKALRLVARCVDLDIEPEARPTMSEVVEALEPLPNMRDMAGSSYLKTIRSDHLGTGLDASKSQG